jgi:hypothetical protein
LIHAKNKIAKNANNHVRENDMIEERLKRVIHAGVMVVAAIAFAGCGQSRQEDPGASADAEAINPAQVSNVEMRHFAAYSGYVATQDASSRKIAASLFIPNAAKGGVDSRAEESGAGELFACLARAAGK